MAEEAAEDVMNEIARLRERCRRLEGALERHTQWFLDEKGKKCCGGCLEPAPCPDAGLIGEPQS